MLGSSSHIEFERILFVSPKSQIVATAIEFPSVIISLLINVVSFLQNSSMKL